MSGPETMMWHIDRDPLLATSGSAVQSVTPSSVSPRQCAASCSSVSSADAVGISPASLYPASSANQSRSHCFGEMNTQPGLAKLMNPLTFVGDSVTSAPGYATSQDCALPGSNVELGIGRSGLVRKRLVPTANLGFLSNRAVLSEGKRR